jgi:glutathione S-transferase
MPTDIAPILIGRSSSHFTRVARMFGEELGVPYRLQVVTDLMSLDVSVYGQNPALKIPVLREGDQSLLGTENICRRFAELAGRGEDLSIVWPEHLRDARARSAQELIWHAMAAQVHLVVTTIFGHVPSDNVAIAKVRASLEGSLYWLDAHVGQAIDVLPKGRALSLLEVTLLCLVEHLTFRPTVEITRYSRLRDFALDYGQRRSAEHTRYRFD